MTDEKITRTVQVLQQGGTALIATDTVYGLAALPTDEAAVAKIYALKARPRDMFLPVMAAGADDLEALGLDINTNAKKLFASDLVPGAVTFVLGFKDGARKPHWLKSREEIAARIPDNALLLSVLKETGPLLVTSANRHGRPDTPAKVKDILAELCGAPDLIVEDGEGRETPSTIINCRHDPPVIERHGAISAETIHHILAQ
ncbi:MAG: threonylcarbamoyl-AMP synthase [Tannerella sp.]|jgi:L-threonylcarbamoyladenylate synthase|nr:threonylcarbamoyl-AMP synthase [Tannerella sp.]